MRISSTFCTVAVAVIAAAGVSIASAAQLKEGVQTPPGEHEVALRRELAAARAELDAMQRGARDASAHAHALAAKQAQILKEQQQIDEALETAQRVIEDFRAEAILWDRERAAEVHPPTEASQLAAKRALDEERHKVELLEQELITARQTIDALKTGANLAAVEKTNAIKDRSVAEPALKQVEEALELERERADSAVRDLDIVRKERDASKQISAELSAALDQERERATGLARSLSAAREAIDIVKDKRRTAALERAPKSRTPLASTLSRSGAQPARKPGLPKKQKVKVKKSPHPVLPATIALPAALLPTRPLNSSTYASED
jgi:chromosome segregation ATPase